MIDQQREYNFILYNEQEDVSSIVSALKIYGKKNQVIQNVSVLNSLKNTDDLIIAFVNNFSDKIFDSIIKLKRNYDNEFVILTHSQDTVLVSTIARLGFNEIYILPNDIPKFKDYLKNFIEKLEYKLISEEKSKLLKRTGFSNLIGESAEFIECIRLAEKISENPNVNLMILGETGTGKGELAKAVHDNSPKASAPFVDIICTAIPRTLLESELFGYEKGAFTDARVRKLGLFELAEEGTIFLDEIGDLDIELQTKLLRAIDNKVIRRLGGTTDIPLKSRIISATNRNLKKLIENEQFRIDLYHRLNVFSIYLPALRNRGEDIILLAEHFIRQLAKKFNQKEKQMDNEFTDFLLEYDWPGNIRELRNALERTFLLSESENLRIEDLFADFSNKKIKKELQFKTKMNLEIDIKDTNINEVIFKLARQILAYHRGNKSKTAKSLGISRPRLDRILIK